MAKGFKHGAGGGAALNFKVAGNPQPAAPADNTIWIDTDVTITGWIFSAIAPGSPTSGMVWISIGTSSTVEFNALKKNGVQVFPISAKQYISGAWVDKTAKIYQGGTWNDFFFYVVRDGVVLVAGHSDGGGVSFSGNKVTFSNGSINCGYYFEVDLTNYKTLEIEIPYFHSYYTWVRLGIYTTSHSQVTLFGEYHTSSGSGSGTCAGKFDVSALTGKYCIGATASAGGGGSGGSATFQNIILC